MYASAAASATASGEAGPANAGTPPGAIIRIIARKRDRNSPGRRTGSLIGAAIIRSLPMRFLGLDSSTQSLTALIIDTDTGEVIDRSVQFGARLPQYRSPNGFLASDDPRIKHSDPLMWVAALDLL